MESYIAQGWIGDIHCYRHNFLPQMNWHIYLIWRLRIKLDMRDVCDQSDFKLWKLSWYFMKFNCHGEVRIFHIFSPIFSLKTFGQNLSSRESRRGFIHLSFFFLSCVSALSLFREIIYFDLKDGKFKCWSTASLRQSHMQIYVLQFYKTGHTSLFVAVM